MFLFKVICKFVRNSMRFAFPFKKIAFFGRKMFVTRIFDHIAAVRSLAVSMLALGFQKPDVFQGHYRNNHCFLEGFNEQTQLNLPATSKGCFLEAFNGIKPTNRHPLDVAASF